jgi:hypothetical protein
MNIFVDKLSTQLTKKMNINQHLQPQPDLDNLLTNDSVRKMFKNYLREFKNSSDNLLTLYLICSCFQTQKLENRQRIKYILEKTYNSCFVQNQLPYLSTDLKQKLRDTLQKNTYNESIFNAVKKELKPLLETEYFPSFLKSKLYMEYLQQQQNQHSMLQSQQQSTSSLKNMHELKQRSSDKSRLKFEDLDLDSNKVSASFAIPNIPTTKQLKHSKSQSSSSTQQYPNSSITSNKKTSIPSSGSSNKLNRTSIQTSKTSSNMNESLFSLNVIKKPLKNSSSNVMPPNPYSVMTKAIPVSTQDSEIQSMISSSDVQIEDNHHHSHKSKQQQIMDKKIKQNIIANKNVKIDIDSAVDTEPKPSRGRTEVKALPKPTAEENPEKFFEMLSTRLEQVLHDEQQNEREQSFQKQQQRSLSNSNIINNAPIISLPRDDINLNLANQQLDYYYNNTDENHTSALHNNNVNKSSLNPKIHGSPRVSNKSMLGNSTSNKNKTKMDMSTNSQNFSFNQVAAASKVPISNTHGKRSLNPFEHQATGPHQFYQLTSTSKEVDIDSHNSHYHHHHHHHQNTKNNNNNADSGVASTRSIASIDRVNDWLITSSGHDEHHHHHDNYNKNPFIKNDKSSLNNNPATISASQQPLLQNNNKNSCAKKTSIEDQSSSKVKTTVAYYLPGEDLAYISTFSGKYLTLAQFKHLITKKGNFRYFFKTKSDLLDEECVVYQEVTDDSAYVPMFNGKVIAKIEKISTTNNNSNLTIGGNNTNVSISQHV